MSQSVPLPTTFRVFISSTFSDLTVERNAIQERVVPRLEAFCREHGAVFQAVDLRWGVSEIAVREQRTMTICLQEIERCQRTTPRPNFVVLLGDRYGWQPLPEYVDASEFEDVLREVTDKRDRDLLVGNSAFVSRDSWYLLDDNAIPPQYVVQSRRRMPAAGACAEELPGVYSEEVGDWMSQQAQVRRVIRKAIERLGWSNDDPRRQKYEASATELEIERGVFQMAEAKEHVMGFFRHIRGLPGAENAGGFLDTDESGRPDDSARQRLRRLQDRLRRHLGSRIREYETEWLGHGPATNHIDALCHDVFTGLASEIARQTALFASSDPLEEEIHAHRRFGERHRDSSYFTGRTGQLNEILQHAGSDASQPMVIRGEAGMGKTALLGRAADELRRMYPQMEIVERFIGTTPASSEGPTLLRGLCQQIARITGHVAYQPPDDFRELVQEFSNRLEEVRSDRPLTLLLDAIDQLSDVDDARDASWVPSELPQHVKVIVSLLPDAAGATRLAQSGAVHDLPPLAIEEGHAILDRWLHDANRTLQSSQRRTLMNGFANCRRPLYLRLAFEEAKRWSSFDSVSALPPDLSDLIGEFYSSLSAETQHGAVLVARSLGYLAASRYGLAENELLSLLSSDPAVMEEYRRRSPNSPAVDRLPPVIWSRLRFDLGPYLAERRAPGGPLLDFYHRQLRQVAVDMYVTHDVHRDRHAALARFFHSVAVSPDDALTWRYDQPHALSELPYHLAQSNDWSSLEELLCDLSFVEAKTRAGLLLGLQADYVLALSSEPIRAERVREFSQFLTEQSNFLAQFSQETIPTARNFAASGAVVEQAEQRIRRLRRTWVARDQRLSVATIKPVNLRTLQGHLATVSAVALSFDAQTIISASHDGELRAWDVATGECRRVLRGHVGQVNCVAITPDAGLAISGGNDRTLRVWAPGSGRLRMTLTGHKERVNGVALTQDGRRAASASLDGTVRIWDLNNGTLTHTLQGHNREVAAVAIAADDDRVVSAGYDKSLRIWSLTSGKLLRVLDGLPSAAMSVGLNADGRTIVTTSAEEIVVVVELMAGDFMESLTGHEEDAEAVAVTPDGRTAISVSHDQTLRLWDLTKMSCEKVIEGNAGWLTSVAISPDGRIAASGGGDHMVRVWDLLGAAQVRLPSHSGAIQAVALLPDGTTLSAGKDGELHAWDATGRCNWSLVGHQDVVVSLGVSECGGWAVTASRDESLRIWDVAQRRCVRVIQYDTGFPTTAVLSPDGKQIISGGEDAILRVWNSSDGRLIRVLPGHRNWILALSITPDGRTLVSSSADQVVHVWDFASGECRGTLDDQMGNVGAIVMSPDCRMAVTGGADGVLRVWDVRSARLLRRLPEVGVRIHSVGCSTDGNLIVSGGSDGVVRIHELQTGALVTAYSAKTSVLTVSAINATERFVCGTMNGELHFLRLCRSSAARATAASPQSP